MKAKDNVLISPTVDFEKATLRLATWTSELTDVQELDAQACEGLPQPVWRQIRDTDTGNLVESLAYGDFKKLTDTTLPPGTTNITTTVWYGDPQNNTRGKEKSLPHKLHRNLMKGARYAAAVFLLVAMVMMMAGTNTASGWTGRMYGTSSADIWEVFGTHGSLMTQSVEQGWRPLMPLMSSPFGKEELQQHVDISLETRNPRLVVVEAALKVWNATWHPISQKGMQQDRKKR